MGSILGSLSFGNSHVCVGESEGEKDIHILRLFQKDPHNAACSGVTRPVAEEQMSHAVNYWQEPYIRTYYSSKKIELTKTQMKTQVQIKRTSRSVVQVDFQERHRKASRGRVLSHSQIRASLQGTGEFPPALLQLTRKEQLCRAWAWLCVCLPAVNLLGCCSGT